MSNIIDSIQLSGSSYDVRDKSATTVVALTQQQYDELPSSAKTDTSKMYVITDAEPGDLSQYWTSAQTNSAITEAVSGKQDTLVSGTNIKTINNTSILGSGNIDVGTNLPISAGTVTNSLIMNHPANIASGNCSVAEGLGTVAGGTYSHAEGGLTQANGVTSHAEGSGTVASGDSSHAEGGWTTANGDYSHAEGYYTITKNNSEHASGRYNVSSSASTTFGDSGNTLFSIGNGTADNERHNVLEIRQNGDIYIPYAGNDIKLQDKIAEFQSVISDWVQTMIGVEYIQSSDGYQYINLGYVPQGAGVEIGGEIMIISYPTTAQWMTTAYISYTGEQYEAFRMIRRSNEDGTLYCNHHTKASGQGQAISMTLGNKYTFKFTDSEYQFGADSYTNSGTTGTTNTATIKLFGNGSAIGAITRIYSFYIKKNDALVMNLIPVVKNGVGMMYDKISGQFFANDGTGSFTFPS